MNYLKIEHSDVCNGTGLRCSIWLSGCSHRCPNCFNQESWSPDNGILFDEVAKQEIFAELSNDYISGITITGGDPLYESNLDDVLSLINEVRISYSEKNIWLYTGYHIFIDYPESHKQHKCIISTRPNALTNIIYDNDLFLKKQEEDRKRSEIISLCDVVIDGEYINEQRNVTLKWRGSSNQRVIDVKKSLSQNKIILYCD